MKKLSGREILEVRRKRKEGWGFQELQREYCVHMNEIRRALWSDPARKQKKGYWRVILRERYGIEIRSRKDRRYKSFSKM